MKKVHFSYKTTLPKSANAPSVYITDDSNKIFIVSFYIIREGGLYLISEREIKGGEIAYSESHQWFDNWFITVQSEGNIISIDTFNPISKVIFIKMDAYALGDNIAWIPYVEEFRKKHNCTVICSTFFNDLFKDIYPHILFVGPNINIDNVYAQYYIGVGSGDFKYSPVITNNEPLQKSASQILGLDFVEIRTPIYSLLENRKFDKKYVCISEYASHESKHWKYPGGWQTIVNFLNSLNYEVWVISKEKTTLENVVDLSGDQFNIIDRAHQLNNADFFIGVSSGLSWLSWAVNTHVIMISDVTPIHHEFQSNITRISANPNLLSVDYSADEITHPQIVIDSISNLLPQAQ